MKKFTLFFTMLCIIRLTGVGQLAIGPGTPVPDASAMLDVQGTNKGLLIPRLTQAQITGITSPATGLIVFQTDGTPGFYYNNGTPASPSWVLLSPGTGGSGYIQNQTTADQAAGFRINGNGIFNGGQAILGFPSSQLSDFTVIDSNAVVNIRSGSRGFGTSANTPYNKDFKTGLNILMSGNAPSGSGINISASSANFNGLIVTHASSSTSNSFYGIGASLSSTNIASGYLAYRTSSGNTYGIFGLNGTTAGSYTSGNASVWAAFLKGRTVISSESAPTSALGTDLEVRNTTTGTGAPATIGLRQTTNNTGANTLLANINFGDNYTTAPQAQIQTLRDATSVDATDLPTAIAFSTTADGTTTLSERMRISNNGNIGINQTSPDASAILDISSTSKGIRFPQLALTAANAAGPVTNPATGLLVYNTATAGTAPNDIVPGYYFNAGTPSSPSWKRFATSSVAGDAWSTTGNNNSTNTSAPATYGTSVFTTQNFLGTSTNNDVIFGTNNLERMRLHSSGQLSIGSASPGAKLDVHQTTGTAAARFVNYGNAPILEFRRTSGSQSTPTDIISSGTFLGRITGMGYVNGGYIDGARIDFATDGVPSSTSMPGRISFNTTPSGTTSAQERMRIDNAGTVSINSLATAGIVTNTAAGVLGTTAVIPVSNGGTGLSSYTTGDLLYASAAGTLARLAAVATGSVLVSNGVGAAPSWASTSTIGGFWARSGTNLTPATSGDKVGIGIAAPTAMLEVRSANAYTSAGYDQLINLGGNLSNGRGGTIYRNFANGQAYIGFESIDPASANKRPLVFQEYGGNVGIGTNNPQSPLHIKTGSGNTFLNIDNNAASTAQSGINLQGAGGTRSNMYYDPNGFFGGNGALLINNVGASSPNTLLNPGGGNVGVGINGTPSALFSVGSSSQFQVNGSGKVSISTGANQSVGTATLSGGTATVNTGAVTANSLIYVTLSGCNNCGVLYISSKNAGTSFTVTSNNGSDSSPFNWWIIN